MAAYDVENIINNPSLVEEVPIGDLENLKRELGQEKGRVVGQIQSGNFDLFKRNTDIDVALEGLEVGESLMQGGQNRAYQNVVHLIAMEPLGEDSPGGQIPSHPVIEFHRKEAGNTTDPWV